MATPTAVFYVGDTLAILTLYLRTSGGKPKSLTGISSIALEGRARGATQSITPISGTIEDAGAAKVSFDVSGVCNEAAVFKVQPVLTDSNGKEQAFRQKFWLRVEARAEGDV